ncbi:unnamed protein product [Closterium sp. NIES-53]
MIHFLWPFAVWYAAHQLNLRPRVSLPEISPTLRWTRKVGDASVFWVWGSRAFVRDTSVDKLSFRAIPCVFLGFPLDALGWQFYLPSSRRVLPSQDVTFDEPVPFYHLFPYHTAPLPPPPPLFLARGPPPVDPLSPQGPAPAGVSQVDPLPGIVPVKVAVDSVAARGAASGGATSGGAAFRGAEHASAERGGAESVGADSVGAEPGGIEPKGAEPGGTESEGAEFGGAESGRRSYGCLATTRTRLRSGNAGAGGSAAGGTGAGGTGATSLGGAGVTAGARFLGAGGTGAGGAGAGGAGAGDPGAGGAGAEGTGAGGAGAGGTGAGDSGAGGPSTGGTGAGGGGAGGTGAGEPGARGAGAGVLELAVLVLEALCSGARFSFRRRHRLCRHLTRSFARFLFGMWIFRVKRPPGSPPVIKARYIARGFSQRQGVDYFQTFSPTPKMTTFQVLLHVAAQRDYELHSLDFSKAFLQGSLHEEIWLRRPPGFTSSFPAGTQWSLRRPVYSLHQAPREWDDTLRTTLVALGFDPSTTDLSLFLRTDTLLPPLYVLVYVDALVFATADTEAMALVKSELQKRHTCTDLGPSALRLPVLLAIVHSPAYRSLALSSTFGRVRAMAAQELCWLTYLLTDLGERPRSSPVLYVDNKAMIALCHEHRLEHRAKHIALRYFLAQELQQRGQLHISYVATRANIADIFTKALQSGDHQPCFAFLD